jgi:hypothetical protein
MELAGAGQSPLSLPMLEAVAWRFPKVRGLKGHLKAGIECLDRVEHFVGLVDRPARRHVLSHAERELILGNPHVVGTKRNRSAIPENAFCQEATSYPTAHIGMRLSACLVAATF